MSMDIIIATLVLGVLGVLGALLLGVASNIFKVEQDEKLPLVIDALPGANCGACGYAGCSNFAGAVIEGTAKVNGCPVGGETSANKISEIMGIVAEKAEKMVAYVSCNGGTLATKKFNYVGPKDCISAASVQGGNLECASGCLGFGSCAKACPFDAISMIDGVAKVITEKCTACTKCVATCPKKLIELIKEKQKVTIPCSSTEKGGIAKKQCPHACIGCKLCQKACPFDAIDVENNLATINYDKCKNCGKCVGVCPQKIIINTRVVKPKPAPKPIETPVSEAPVAE